MFWRLNERAVPTFFLVLSGLWTAGTFFPLFYSLAFPNHEIQHLIGALGGHESPRQELSSFVQNVVSSSGYLTHAIRVTAYYVASAEYNQGKSHTSKETEFSYLAWFEKRPKPTILVVNVTELDAATVRFNVWENEPIGLARILLLPLGSLALSLYWFRRRKTRKQTSPTPTAVPSPD